MTTWEAPSTRPDKGLNAKISRIEPCTQLGVQLPLNRFTNQAFIVFSCFHFFFGCVYPRNSFSPSQGVLNHRIQTRINRRTVLPEMDSSHACRTNRLSNGHFVFFCFIAFFLKLKFFWNLRPCFLNIIFARFHQIGFWIFRLHRYASLFWTISKSKNSCPPAHLLEFDLIANHVWFNCKSGHICVRCCWTIDFIGRRLGCDIRNLCDSLFPSLFCCFFTLFFCVLLIYQQPKANEHANELFTHAHTDCKTESSLFFFLSIFLNTSLAFFVAVFLQLNFLLLIFFVAALSR